MGGTDLDAVNAAYQVVLPRDAVAGVPAATNPMTSAITDSSP
jgi:nicotinamidase-related amidase